MSLTAENAPARAGAAMAGRVPPLVVLYFLTILVPVTAIFFIGPVQLTPQKLYLTLIALPLLGLMLSQGTMRRHDWLFLSYVGWICLCTFLNYRNPTLTGLMAINNLATYALAKTAFRNPGDVARTARLLALMVMVLGLLAIPEAVLRVRFLPDMVEQISGYSVNIQREDLRLGLMRAASVFAHPILFGLFCAASFSMAWYMTRSSAALIVTAVMIAIATLMALSSGPLLALMIQLMLIIGERRTRHIRNRAKYLLVGVASVIVILEIITNRGALGIIVGYFALNPATAYNRLLILQHARDDILRNPIFGMRVEEWTRPFWMKPSVDNFWVMQSLRGGLVATGLLIAALILMLRNLFRHPDSDYGEDFVRARRGIAYTIIAICLCGGAVHLFAKLEPFFAFLLGTASAVARFGENPQGGSPANADPAPQAPLRRRTVLP